jgi:hypothetical protein
VTDCGRHPWFAALRRKNDVIEQIAIGGTHTEGPFRRPCSGASLFLDNTPGVPLRSTPGFTPAHPQGAVAGIQIDAQRQTPPAPKARCGTALRSTPGFNPAHPQGAVAEIRIRARAQHVSAPKARCGTALRSTPGFNPAHPQGAVAEIRIRARAQRVSAPKARWNGARSEAKRTPGIGCTMFPNPCQGVTENGFPSNAGYPAEELKK